MTDIPTKKGATLSVTAAAMLFSFAASASAAYYPVAYLQSQNLLSGQIAVSISSFDYSVSALPAGSALRFQFSVDNSIWYNSSGTADGWDAAASGSNTISLSTLGWNGGSFYYKAKFTSSGSNTPILDDIALNYTSGSNYPPNQPSNSTPSSGGTAEKNQSLTAEAYSDTESDAHTDTQWQVDDDSDFSSPVWTRTAGAAETGTVVTSANGTFANELAGETALSIGTTYYWRVRYSDGNWSSWSAGTSMNVAAYYPSAYLVSTNILSGRAVSGIDSFTYNLSAKPSGTTASVQFSQDSSAWYNSSGVSGGTDTLSTGSNTIDLSGLGWSGANFYYRVKMTSGGTDTPVLDDVSIVYTATAATWDGSSSNDWNTGANWDIGSAPGNYHDVVISSDGSPVLSANEELGNLTIQTGGTLDLNGYDLVLNDGGSFSNFGTLRLHGDETLTSFTNDTDSGTVEYDGTGTYTSFPAGNSYGNIRFTNSGDWTPDGNMDVDGTFTMTGGTFRQGAYRLNIAGNMTIESGAVFTKSGNGSLLVLDGDLTLENAAGANLGNVQVGSSPDTTTLSRSLIADSLTVAAGDTLITNGYNVIVGTGGITNSGTIIASGGAGSTTSISTASGFVNHGTFTAGSSTLTVSGSLIIKGTFTANTGSVVLDGTSQTLSGSTTFYNLTKTVSSADTLTFYANDTFTVSNTLTLQGAVSNLLSLRSSTTGTQWRINPQGTRTISYLDVKDSNNTNATAMDATGGTNVNSGNNTNWQFSLPTVSFQSGALTVGETAGNTTLTITLSGTALSDVTIPFSYGGTATGTGTDYTFLTPSPLVLEAGETSTGIILSLTDDSAVESDETITLSLGTPTNASLGSTGSMTITLTSDDSAPAPAASSEETTSAATPSGGSRGGYDSAAMQSRIAQAHSRILALYEGKRRESVQIAAEENRAADEEQEAKERETRIAKRIAEHKAAIAQLQQEKEELQKKYALRREERYARALVLEEHRIAEEQVALETEQRALAEEQKANAVRREERLAERSRLTREGELARREEEEHEERAAKEREARIAQQIAEHEAAVAQSEKDQEELERKYALRRDERYALALKLEQEHAAAAQAALEAGQQTLREEQEANAKRREERLAKRERLEGVIYAAAPVADPSVIAERRGRLFAYVGTDPVIYADVPTDEWYAPYVSYVVEEKIATGYADETGKPKGEFGVANPVTIAEILKMAMEAADTDFAGVPPPRNNSAQNTWASSYVAKAEELHLPVVTPERNVNESATRGEVTAIILHALNMPIRVQEDRVRGIFTDIPDSHPYRREILAAFVFGIIQGDTDAEGNPTGTFRPDDPTNRAEVSKIIALVKEAFR
ncbi:hypothetical protein AUJ46_06375 [Candidatus Peregrinibacteria bacterium CG1_02_54_53]|nr:MAG: hypothetical protein AUJ46_06375 [Candidatus Peregrinibacteria bacterium CG1_02_54_53]